MKDYTLDVPLALKNTNPAIFVDWLKGYVASMRNHYAFEKKMTTNLWKRDTEQERTYLGMPWAYDVDVEILCFDDDDDFIGGGIITFETKPLYYPFIQEGNWINGTVDVTVTGELTWGSGPREYIRELLLEIAQRWDGVGDQLEKFPWMYPEEHSGDDGTAEQPVAENGEDDRPPWEEVPDHNWDREAVRLWWEGHTVPEIARQVFVEEKTARNRLTILRQTYGNKIVPTARQLRKMGMR
jgi:hypothetical protein